jgi:hypothetical protein
VAKKRRRRQISTQQEEVGNSEEQAGQRQMGGRNKLAVDALFSRVRLFCDWLVQKQANYTATVTPYINTELEPQIVEVEFTISCSEEKFADPCKRIYSFIVTES